MAVRIGPDGTIITGETSGNDPAILEDGTIEMSGSQQRDGSLGSSNSTLNLSTRTTNVISGPAPVSPLENQQRTTSGSTNTVTRSTDSNRDSSNSSLGDLEYAVMVEEGKIRSSSPKAGIIVAVICTLMAIFFSAPILLIGTVVGIVIIVMKKSTFFHFFFFIFFSF